MSNQIVISSGAKVRNLNGVLTGTSGIVNSLGINVPDGIPQLDGSGKILVSQLPNSVMEFKGTWNAATNTPTLANGTGNAGDVYLCNVAGTVNFGSGPITFAIGDQVLYSGTTWERASGATGTVTSVAVTESGDALTITGSPITTSGTINIGFAGTSGQYVNGAGGLTTFPSLTGFVPYTGATGNVNLGEFGITSGFVGFDLTPTGTPTVVGTLSWDSAYRTLQLIDGDGDTTLQIGQEQRALIHNNTGATLTDGQVVYVTGSTGNLPTVALASNTLEASSSVTFGVVTETIANGADGFVTISGTVNGLNTLAYNEGDALYLGSTAGTFTNVKPVAPANLVLIGYMIKKAGGNGSIFVKIQNGYELEELHDVLVTSVANNQGLFWDSATSLWKNKSIATALGYTPADDSLVVKLAGSQTITGVKTFTSEIRVNTTDSTGGVLNLKRGTFIGPIPNYTSIFSEGDELSIASQGTTTLRYAKFNLAGLTSGTTRTYTLPDATGTIALTSDLSAYVTLSTTQNNISGTKSFTSDQGTGFQYGIGISKNNTPSGFLPSTYIQVYSEATANNIVFRDDLSKAKFIFNNSTQTFTFPAATGTIALTSDIPSLTGYVPYTGATTFVDLGANSATASYFQGNSGILLGQNSTISTSGAFTVIGGDADGISIRPSSSRVFLLTFPSTGRQYIFPNAAGTIALTSNIPANIITGTGTTNYLPKFTGTGTIGNSSIVDDGLVSVYTTALRIFNSAGTGPSMFIQSNGADEVNVTSLTSTSQSKNFGFYGSKISFWTGPLNGTTTTETFTLASTGAATFSSSVTGVQGIFSASANTYPGGSLILKSSTGTNPVYLTSNIGYFALSNGGGGDHLIISSTGAATFSSSVTANQISSIVTSGTARIAIGDGAVSGGALLNLGGISGGKTWFISSNYNIGGGLEFIQSTTNGGTTPSSSAAMSITSGGILLIGRTSVGSYNANICVGSATTFTADFMNAAGTTLQLWGTGSASTTWNGTDSATYIGKNTSTNRSLSAAGTLNASGADYAEYMTKAIEDNINKGDIVGVDSNGLLTNIFSDAISFVIKSTNPSYVGGDDWGIGIEDKNELELAKQKVDRIAFSGQVPCNVLDAQVGDYIIPIELEDGKISGQAVTNPTFEQYQISVGKVWKIMEDGRAWIAVKIG